MHRNKISPPHKPEIPFSAHAIRHAKPGDLEQIISISNQAVVAGNCTTDIEALVVEERREWFARHSPEKYPIYVMEEGEAIIRGWCSLVPIAGEERPWSTLLKSAIMET
ncbi:MAG: hypothetical protein KJ804_22460 [Proteobacteria bacterium]|nr:hypothetical protein [Pseudomonadota bacterium]MBU1061073.1 hypothetical protein [Pseudomonadota bacterium]